MPSLPSTSRLGRYLLGLCLAVLAWAAPAAPQQMLLQVKGPDGKGREGVSLELVIHPEAAQPKVVLRTGPDGSTRVEAVCATPLYLSRLRQPRRAAGPALYPLAVSGDVEPDRRGGLRLKPRPDAPAHVEVRLGPGRALVQGTVTDAAGQPLAGVQVRLRPLVLGSDTPPAALLLDPDDFADMTTAVTTAKGAYSIVVPPGRYGLGELQSPPGSTWFDVPQQRRSTTVVAVPERPTTLNLQLQQGGAFRLAMRDEQDRPLAGCVASWGRRGSPGQNSIAAGADGDIVSPGLPDGVYKLTIAPPPGSTLAPVEKQVAIEVGAVSRDTVRFALGANAHGRVLDQDGKPLPGLHLLPGGAVSGPDGRYQAHGLPAGWLRLVPDRDQHPNWIEAGTGRNSALLRAVPGQDYELDVILRQVPTTVLRGRVSGPKDEPVAGIALLPVVREALPEGMVPPEPVITDANGEYRIPNLLVSSHLRLYLDFPSNCRYNLPGGGNLVWVVLREQAENVRNLPLELAQSLRVTVLDHEGRPAAGQRLRLFEEVKPQGQVRHQVINVINLPATDEKGVAETLLVRRSAKEWAARRLRLDTDSGGPVYDVPAIPVPDRDGVVEATLRILPGARIAGQVYRDDGTPVAAATLSLATVLQPWRRDGETPEARRGSTDEEGVYCFDDVNPGQYRLTVRPPAQDPGNLVPPRSATLIVGQKDRLDSDFQMLRGGVVSGQVYGPDDQPVPALVVLRATEASGEPLTREYGYATPSDPAAKRPYRISRVPPGRYRLVISQLAGAPFDPARAAGLYRFVLEVRPGEEIVQDLRL